MKPFLYGLVLFHVLIFSLPAAAQKDTLKEVTVSGVLQSGAGSSVLNIEPVKISALAGTGAVNLTDALRQVPGVSQLSTTPAISKPVIRGLSGTRILVLLDGLRFENQQWQEEHGLGLPYIGIDRIELIKGAASALYGTDALGGVINIISEQPEPSKKHSFDAGVSAYSNTRGVLADAGYSFFTPSKHFNIRIGVENHADYSDGNNNRVLNSRNNGYYLKSGYGIVKGRWKSDNNYTSSLTRSGFILQDLGDVFTPDPRWTRTLSGPHHIVLLNLLSSRNSLFLPKAVLRLNGGLQSNLRMEDEGGGQVSLNMHMLSAILQGKLEKPAKKGSSKMITSGQLTWEQNTNYGGRVIIPDASMFEAMASVFYSGKSRIDPNLTTETGLSIDDKWIKTLPTGMLNAPGKEIHPFSINRFSANGFLGFSYLKSHETVLKVNIAMGSRAPNLAELASDGLHEGTFHYELGDPNLKSEHNVTMDGAIESETEKMFLSGSMFLNGVRDYIYLAPTGEDHFGFPVYRYFQSNALLYGGEAVANLKLHPFITWKNNAAYVVGVKNDGGYLPFIPPLKLTTSIRFGKKYENRKLKSLFAEPEAVYCFAQKKTASEETDSPGYLLLNFSSGVSCSLRNRTVQIGLSGRNLLNRAYADHLNRLRDFGVLNPGRSININLRFFI